MHAAQCFSRPRRGALVGIASALVMLAGAGSAHAEPHTYQIDAEHFGISFSIRHLGFADTLGLFLKARGSFVYDEKTRVLSAGRVVVDAKSVFTNHDARDKHVRDDDFLAAKAHPEIVFVADAFEPTSDQGGRLAGKLTLRGQTHPVVLDVVLNKAADYPMGHGKHTLGVSASTTIKRSQWGMSYAVEPPMVGDEVKLVFEFEANRE
ncbi:hypothetical protein M622_06560 [Thauera terpenica 58Eu]|jgi:polyisoprenoid-binding protein YceI|uniref:Lipid/polyisoprenoid-binding YceI-like domain-containing protein n=1 Tax=Thauera terpenica 58Eu TaxID=1348657 RepID=T0AUD0_9RHOO|nr:YceI family protein [Thauera terpenica]EPZ14233.1 hypothetical protein M622_06560 [Thauera terpenica 58Eu]MBP6726093.1 YceI family protein [Thauera sp.]